MKRKPLKLSVSLVALFLALCGCEAVVGDYESSPCEPDPPTQCSDIGDDTDAQLQGCCAGDAKKVYYCKSGALKAGECAGTCDFNPDADGFACID